MPPENADTPERLFRAPQPIVAEIGFLMETHPSFLGFDDQKNLQIDAGRTQDGKYQTFNAAFYLFGPGNPSIGCFPVTVKGNPPAMQGDIGFIAEDRIVAENRFSQADRFRLHVAAEDGIFHRHPRFPER